MPTFYIELKYPLSNHYVLVEAKDTEAVQQYAAKHFGKVYGRTYTEDHFNDSIVRRYPASTRVVNASPVYVH